MSADTTYPQLPKLPVCSYSASDAERDVEFTCQVIGCKKSMSQEKHYYRKFGVCEEHMKSSHIVVEGVLSRFCQQCGKFHNLNCFDGTKRSCRETLQKHSSRRASHKRPHSQMDGKVPASDQSHKSEAEQSFSLRPKGLVVSSPGQASKCATPSCSPSQSVKPSRSPQSANSTPTTQHVTAPQPALSSSNISTRSKLTALKSRPSPSHTVQQPDTTQSQTEIDFTLTSAHTAQGHQNGAQSQLPVATPVAVPSSQDLQTLHHLLLNNFAASDTKETTPLSPRNNGNNGNAGSAAAPKRARRISENASFSSLLPSGEWGLNFADEQVSQAASQQPAMSTKQAQQQQQQPTASLSSSDLPQHVTQILGQLSAADRQQLIQWLSDKTLEGTEAPAAGKHAMETDQSADSKPRPAISVSGGTGGNSTSAPRTSPFQIPFTALTDSSLPRFQNGMQPELGQGRNVDQFNRGPSSRSRRLSLNGAAALSSLGGNGMAPQLFPGLLPDTPLSSQGCRGCACGPHGSSAMDVHHHHHHAPWSASRLTCGMSHTQNLNPQLLQQWDGFRAMGPLADPQKCGYGCACSSGHCVSRGLFTSNDMDAGTLQAASIGHGQPLSSQNHLQQQFMMNEGLGHGLMAHPSSVPAALSAGFPLGLPAEGRKHARGSCSTCSSCTATSGMAGGAGMQAGWEADAAGADSGVCHSNHPALSQWLLPQADAEALASLRPVLMQERKECSSHIPQPWNVLDAAVAASAMAGGPTPFQLPHHPMNLPTGNTLDCQGQHHGTQLPQLSNSMAASMSTNLGERGVFNEAAVGRGMNESHGFAMQRYLASLLHSQTAASPMMPPEPYMDEEGYDPSSAMLGLMNMLGAGGGPSLK